MSDTLDKHIGALTLGSDAVPEDKPGLFDAGDTLIEEELQPTPIPREIHDEQAKVFSEASGERPAPKEEEAPKDYKALYEATQHESQGRMGEIDKLRGRMSETNESIEGLRQLFLEREQAEAARVADEEAAFELSEERRLYGDEVVDDPAVAYMRDKWVQTQDMLTQQDADRANQQAAFAQRSAEISAANAQFEQVKSAVITQEAEFAKEKPDYFEAYDYARKARIDMYQDIGWDANQANVIVNQEEEGIRQQQLSRPGGSVPGAIYAIAERFGWSPEKATSEEAKGDYNKEAPNFDKMRAGVSSRGSGELAGSSGTGQDKRMTAAEFYDTVPIAKRIEIQSDPDKFEELGRTGFITVDW